MGYLEEFSTRKTPQSEPMRGDQVPNSAGGYSWSVDDWTRMERFLILGSEGGTYYIGQRELTLSNAQSVLRCIKSDGVRAVKLIVAVSKSGRAPRNNEAIFALALACAHADDRSRPLALLVLPDVCRTGEHLFQFVTYVEQFRGWGRGLRRAVGRWYDRAGDRGDLAYQLIKYRQRHGWTHRDLLRLAHPEHRQLLAWAAGKPVRRSTLPTWITAFERAQTAKTPAETVSILTECPLPREALQPEHLNSPEVWEAMLHNAMPMTALIRNLATMTRVGALKPMSEMTQLVCEQISDSAWLRAARVHPLTVLVALKTYAAGQGERGKHTWEPIGQIVDALDAAFYEAFEVVEPTNKRTLLALDVSASMDWPQHTIKGMSMTAREGAAAMALVTARTEPRHHIMAFSHGIVPLAGFSSRLRLDSAVRRLRNLPHGGTDCALPIAYAFQNGLEVDTFVVYTDNETWAGRMHPAQALREYREKTGIAAKLVVVGMAANEFSIADPTDAGMLDVVGFDTAAPRVISDFSAA